MSTAAIAALLGTLTLAPSVTDEGDTSVTADTDTIDVAVTGFEEPDNDWLQELTGQAGAANSAEASASTPPPPITCEPDASSPTGYTTYVHGGGLAGHNGLGGTPNGALGPCEPGDGATSSQRTITPAMILQAFRRIPLPAAEVAIQPPGGETLVNLDTIFSTTARDLDRTVTLLGRRVQLRITPTTYTWHHGDGTSQTSDWPGRPWEDGVEMSAYLVHAYDDADVTVRPSVDVTYSAEYRVGNGPWRPVDGTVTIEGPAASLRILEARPVLTGDGR